MHLQSNLKVSGEQIKYGDWLNYLGDVTQVQAQSTNVLIKHIKIQKHCKIKLGLGNTRE
jgi:hypothetical protein